MQLTKLHRWLILMNISVSIFMATLDGSIVNLALPVMSQKLSVDIGSIQWIVTSYLLAISSLLLIWGKISDLYGKKIIFALGFIVFTVGSFLCGISASLGMLIFSRVIQAIGASSMMALSQGIITSTFPPSERGKALGISGTMVAIGSLAGPSLGGFLVDKAGWHSIFLINIPIGIIGTVLTFKIIPKLHETPSSKDFDYKGSSMFVSFILLLFMGLLFLQEGNISMEIFLLMLLSSVIVLFFFIKYEQKSRNPLIDLSLFQIRTFSSGLCTAFLSFIALNTTLLFMPFYLMHVLGFSPSTSGLLISAYPLATAFIAPVSGWLSDKITYKPLTVTGLLLSTVMLFKLSTLGTSSTKTEIVIFMALLGVGSAIFQSPNNSSIMGSVPRNQLGIAGGINSLFRNLGMVSGTALSVLIFTFSTKMDINKLSPTVSSSNTNTIFSDAFSADTFLKGFKIVFLFAAISCLAAFIISLSRLSGSKKDEKNCEFINPKPDTE
jgi:EmrB/QacA subfamily drug resistance transporter